MYKITADFRFLLCIQPQIIKWVENVHEEIKETNIEQKSIGILEEQNPSQTSITPVQNKKKNHIYVTFLSCIQPVDFQYSIYK